MVEWFCYCGEVRMLNYIIGFVLAIFVLATPPVLITFGVILFLLIMVKLHEWLYGDDE